MAKAQSDYEACHSGVHRINFGLSRGTDMIFSTNFFAFNEGPTPLNSRKMSDKPKSTVNN